VTGNDVTWFQVTGSDLEVTSFDRKSPWSVCRGPKTCVFCAFDFLQGCSSQEEAVTWPDITSRDLRWQEVIRKWRHLTGSHMEVAVEGRKLVYTVRLTSYKAVARRRRQSRDRKWRHMTSGNRSDPEVMSFNRKSPGSGCRRVKTCVNCVWIPARLYLVGGGSHVAVNDITWPQVTESAPEVTWFDRKYLEVAVEGWKLVYFVRLTSYKAVARRMRPSRDRKACYVTSGDRKWPWNHVLPKVNWKWVQKAQNWSILCALLPTRLLLAGGGSHVTGNDVTRPQVTVSDPEVTSFDRKSPGSGYRRPKTCVYCAFDFLQGCSSQEEAVTWQDMTSRDLCDRKWFGSDVIWAEVTWKWL